MKTLLVVDVQPEYGKYVKFDMDDFIFHLSSTNKKIIYMYNGEAMGMSSEVEIMSWLYEHGMEEELINKINFIEKDYGWIRYPIDNGMDEEEIISVLKEMINHGIGDSSQMEASIWGELELSDEMVSFLERGRDSMAIPTIYNSLLPLNNIELIGGSIKECIYEVELLLEAMNKDYEYNHALTYGPYHTPDEYIRFQPMNHETYIDSLESTCPHHKI